MIKLLVYSGYGANVYSWETEVQAALHLANSGEHGITVRLATPDEIEANQNITWGGECPQDDYGEHIMLVGDVRCRKCSAPHPAYQKMAGNDETGHIRAALS